MLKQQEQYTIMHKYLSENLLRFWHYSHVIHYGEFMYYFILLYAY